jgi:hypothetical protein
VNSPLVELALTVLAAIGALALAARLVRAVGGALLATAAVVTARSAGETSARRGDLTSMREGKGAERMAKTARNLATLTGLFWLAWLVVPLVFGLIPWAYALAAPLWFIRRPLFGPHRPDQPGGRSGGGGRTPARGS